MANYVKFMRGPKAAYDALQHKDANTLYFVTLYNENNDPIETDMYLGEMLISASASGLTLSQAALDFLNQLTQAMNPDAEDPNQQIQDGQFLIYSVTENKWIPASLNIFTGANSEQNGSSGLVPQPLAGEQDKYLRGDGSWADLTSEVLPQVLAQIIGDSEDDKISNDFDTLKEISDWILNHPTSAAEINTRLNNLETALGFEYKDVPIQALDEESEDGLAWEKDDEGNYLFDETGNKIPVYETQLIQALDATSEDGFAWEKNENGDYILDEEGNKIPIYKTKEIEVPVQKLDPETGDPLFDDEGNPIYETEQIGLIDPDTGEPIIDENTGEQATEERIVTQSETVYVEETVTDHVLDPDSMNKFIHFQTVVGDLSSLLGYQTNPEPTLTVINNISSNVGDLNELLLKKEDTKTDEGDPESLVDAINILDTRTRWQELTI